MKNVTLTLNEEVVRWARVRAAQLDTTVSRLLSDLIREEMALDLAYDSGMRYYRSREPRVIHERGAEYPSRNDLY